METGKSPVYALWARLRARWLAAHLGGYGRIGTDRAGTAKGAARYSMCCSKAADFGGFQVVRRTRYTTRTFQKALKKCTYYIRVKSYRKLGNGKRIYGEWSKQVKLRVK